MPVCACIAFHDYQFLSSLILNQIGLHLIIYGTNLTGYSEFIYLSLQPMGYRLGGALYDPSDGNTALYDPSDGSMS